MRIFTFKKSDIYSLLLILLTSLFTVAELFLTSGRSANMDGIVHTMTPNLFYLAIRQGEFPVSWIDGFANYGLPLGMIAHQLPTYLTAFLQFLVGDPVIAFNILAFFGYFLSTLFFYFFLRIYFRPIPSFASVIFFNFAPYRILNIFIRGAMPEFLAGVFVPLVLISLYLLVEKRNIYGGFLLALSICAIALTHPFMLVISSFLAIPYFIFLLVKNDFFSIHKLRKISSIKLLLSVVVFAGIGVGMAGYFLFPLLLEIKYFYYGLTKDHLTPGNFLGLSNFFDPNWYYFTTINILPRGFVVNVGLIESIIFILGLLFAIYLAITKKPNLQKGVLYFACISGLCMVFFMTAPSEIFYRYISVLSGIQFPWRLLAVFVFIPPIILAYFLGNTRKYIFALIIILIICVIRFPQLYGKNYVVYPPSDYEFTPLNLHATVMNPIWSGRSEDYPIQKEKAAFIEGTGTIQKMGYKNSIREYVITAASQSKLVDYTFYFPGWNVYVDGQKSTIEYQDPKYRGVITYAVPKGKHTVKLVFEDTKVRSFGKMISLISFCLLIFGLIFHRKLSQLLS